MFACGGRVSFLPGALLSLIIFNTHAVFLVIILQTVTLT